MNCKAARNLFSAYLDNSIDSSRKVDLEKHLADCEQCDRAYSRFRYAISMLERLPDVNPPAGFRASVMARVEVERRKVPARVRWWSIDWQKVFTIRVPARALAVGLAVLIAFVISLQVLPPLRTGIAGLFLAQKPSEAPISTLDQESARAPMPWTPENRNGQGLILTLDVVQSGVYCLKLHTKSLKPVAFDIDISGTKYSGFVVADKPSAIKVPAPRSGSVRVVHVAWSIGEWGRYQTVFLPSKLRSRAVVKTFSIEKATVADVLRRICREYGVAIIAWGNLGKPVAYAQVYQATPDDALYECLNRVGFKAYGVAASIYAVEPVR
ncbi:MAG: zf-HC2 domain-containing protein [Armatimonadota bacterium]|nr:zf-HC2 domain-containing protein [Armatimonadota bacterium]